MFDDVLAVEFLIPDKLVTVWAVELLVFGFAGGTIPFNHDSDGVRWSLRRMRLIRRNLGT